MDISVPDKFFFKCDKLGIVQINKINPKNFIIKQTGKHEGSVKTKIVCECGENHIITIHEW